MKKEILVKELKDVKLVAHRLGYQMTPYPENSLEAIEYIFKHQELLDSCYGFEFDICFTKDHIPVVIHDKYLDDVSNHNGLVRNYSLDVLRQFTFSFRKSVNASSTLSYKIITLEELLDFFNTHKDKLKDKIIKIETKDYFLYNRNNFNMKNISQFVEIVNRFPNLSRNIIHLSFWPLNLWLSKKIQKRKKYFVVPTDLLCDYSVAFFITHFMSSIDNVSLRIKVTDTETLKGTSKCVRRKIKRDLWLMKHANVLSNKRIKYVLKKYSTVGLYTLRTEKELDTLCQVLDEPFFKYYKDKIIITTDNPSILKKIK